MYTQKCSTPSCRLSVSVILALGFVAALSHVDAAPQPAATNLGISQRKLIYEVNLDNLIDDNMDAIQEGLMPLDPLDLQNLNFPLIPNFFMNLHNGTLQHISMLKRSGKCVVTYTNKLLTLNLNLGWNKIAFDYRYLLKMLLIKRRGDLHGQLSHLSINVEIEVDLEAYQVTLKRLDFDDSGKVTISLEGHITDKIYNLVLKAVTSIGKKVIINTIETKTTDLIQSKIDEFNFKFGKHHNRQLVFVNLVTPNRVYDF